MYMGVVVMFLKESSKAQTYGRAEVYSHLHWYESGVLSYYINEMLHGCGYCHLCALLLASSSARQTRVMDEDIEGSADCNVKQDLFGNSSSRS